MTLINLSNFNTYNLNNMAGVFYGCNSLTSINLSNFDTSNVYNMSQMFYGCDNLNFVDLSNFNMIECNSYNDLFSNVDNIRYINLYNFKTDKIIDSIFSGKENNFYVCQSEKIISNLNALNCCNYNFITNECNQKEYDDVILVNSTLEIKSDTTDNSNGNDKTDNSIGNDSTDNSNGNDSTDNSFGNDERYLNSGGNSKKSSGISIGIIAGIAAGIVAVIGIIILVICLCKKCCQPQKTNDTFAIDKLVTKSSLKLVNDEEYEYESIIKSDTPKINIVLVTTSQRKIKILINPDKTITELIKFYFEKIKRPELFGDKSIRFIMNAQLILPGSKDLIKNYINKNNDVNTIVIDDLDDKIPLA